MQHCYIARVKLFMKQFIAVTHQVLQRVAAIKSCVKSYRNALLRLKCLL